jgi:hypothetical protein
MDAEYHIHKQRLAALRQENHNWRLAKAAPPKQASGTQRIFDIQTRVRRLMLQVAAALRLMQ